MEDLGRRVAALKTLIEQPEVRQLGLDHRLEREVDALIELFYEDIGQIKLLPLRRLFDLFLIKVLYVNRGERDADVLDYLSGMLERFLFARELARLNVRYDFLLSILEETRARQRFQNVFESARQLADNALFVTGIFPSARPSRRRGGFSYSPRFDREYFIELGSRYYRVAAEEELAAVTGQREVLARLSSFFKFYVDSLSELSQRYILGMDMDIIANKMLDAYNLYRRTGDPEHMEAVRKYAALLRVDRRFPGTRRPRGRILNLGPGFA